MGKAEKKRESWQERRKKIRHKWATPLIYPEWICERTSYLLERWAFLDILGHIGRLTILVAVITYFMGADERQMQAENQRKAKQYQAWQVINAAQGQRSSGGRRDALEDLNRDRVSLVGVDISKAYLPWVNLEDAVINDANLVGAHLRGADFPRAKLFRSNLTEAYLREANLTEADLDCANLAKVCLDGADLSGADFVDANLSDANLASAILNVADLSIAHLADIKNWRSIKNIEYANIYDVKNAPPGFTEWAKEQGAVEIKSRTKWQGFKRKKMAEKKK